jgi:hypothetical protein
MIFSKHNMVAKAATSSWAGNSSDSNASRRLDDGTAKAGSHAKACARLMPAATEDMQGLQPTCCVPPGNSDHTCKQTLRHTTYMPHGCPASGFLRQDSRVDVPAWHASGTRPLCITHPFASQVKCHTAPCPTILLQLSQKLMFATNSQSCSSCMCVKAAFNWCCLARQSTGSSYQIKAAAAARAVVS